MKGIVAFYEKLGCRSNARQKQQLRDAGYLLQVVSLLDKKWDCYSLNKFFAGRKIHDCVNQRAPQITSGDFDPATLNEAELLQAMVEHPILIQRPLIFFRGHFACGFQHELVTQLLGSKQAVETCQQSPSCTHHP